ncbi:3-dehydroquinate synthase [Vampirovibrio sp.]|uniref:3-dehydroquinate synthase n=1 Tax=Vampirovibrio sp. TaxID=2717857 RepID=UPI0035932366
MAKVNQNKTQPASVEVLLTASEPRCYAIVAQSGLLSRLGQECQTVLAKGAQILVLTDTHLENRYLPQVITGLKAAGFEVTPLVIPPGEASKRFEQAWHVHEALLANGFTRKDAILGLGGGVIGDLAGFCASTYHRGMGLIHVPTTLVSQVDSAIGGKTAVNLGAVKNLVGTFYQPLRVLADTDTLLSLPPRELAAGMAEVIKYGLIETACDGQSGFFNWLESHANCLQPVFPEMIRRCAEIKAAVVMQDELETKGLRFFLNLGHTFGHAYESLSDFGILHGEAVAIGMLKAVRLSCQLGLFPVEAIDRLQGLYAETGLLPCVENAPAYAAQDLLAVMRHDKKNRDGNIRLVLPIETLGRVMVRDDIPDEAILSVLKSPL